MTLVAKPGGYLEDEAIRILLPSNLRSAEKALRAVGQGPKIDDFVASMNHATYVVNKALDGLFYTLAQQEKEIRTNPAARSTALLKQVFGAK